jgi:DNA helicase-2/ATP-dependent DNA helicase PcrA
VISMEFSAFQKRIFRRVKEGSENIVIEAVAGSGKTTTLIHCLNLLPEESTKIFVAFNNTVVDELKDKIIAENSLITTMHSFCWKLVLKHYRYKCKLNPNKSVKHIERILVKQNVDKKKIGYFTYVYSNLVDLCRHYFVNDIDSLKEIAVKYSFIITDEDAVNVLNVLKNMNSDKKEFDFTDMIYRAILDDVNFSKFDYVFVDESQDLSKLQQIIISKIKNRDGRMIAVGDPMQSIYGFAGADSNSYYNMKNLFANTIEMPLSVNYRCGIDIVSEARKINPKILPFKNNELGKVGAGYVDNITNKDWVVCRNLKPLILLNVYLLSKGIRSFVKGVDIGLGLKQIVNKSNVKTTETMLKNFKTSIDLEREKLIRKGVKNPDKSEKIFMMNQKYEILSVIAYSFNNYNTKDLNKTIDEIFKEQDNAVCLLTIHKSKGLENEIVYFLCPELIPSRFAEQDWELQQENNLKYVAITRAKKELLYVEDYSKVTDYYKEIVKKIEQK